jgi:hypothetical protein
VRRRSTGHALSLTLSRDAAGNAGKAQRAHADPLQDERASPRKESNLDNHWSLTS